MLRNGCDAMEGKGFVSSGSAAKRLAGVPLEHREYEEVRYDRWFPGVTRKGHEWYSVDQEVFLEMIDVTKGAFERLTGYDARGIDVIYRCECEGRMCAYGSGSCCSPIGVGRARSGSNGLRLCGFAAMMMSQWIVARTSG